MKSTKKFKGMDAKEAKSEKPKEMAMGGFAGLMRRGMMGRNPEMMQRMMQGKSGILGGMGGNKQQIEEIIRGKSPDKAAAIRALMKTKTSPANSNDFRASTPKGTQSALGMFKPGLKQSATSGGTPAMQQLMPKRRPDVTISGPNAPTSVMKKGGCVTDAAKKTRYADGGMTMVKKGGKMVPDFAADGKGKMAKGGCVKKMSRGGGIEVKGVKPCKVV